jgi:hypothetical protein
VALAVAYVALVALTLQAVGQGVWTARVLPVKEQARHALHTAVKERAKARKAKRLHSAAPTRQLVAAEEFPAFDHAVFPFAKSPNWGAMRSAAEWERTYAEMTQRDFVPVPAYDMRVLTIPMAELTANRTPEHNADITAKLFYSTRYYGSYDNDSPEYMWLHPGVDLKVALGTPIRAIGGGRVKDVSLDGNLGLHVTIEHRVPGEGTLFSIYAHLGDASVVPGQDVAPGQLIGTVGMTGNTTGAHLHLQIDRDTGKEPHIPFWPDHALSPEEAAQKTVHPIEFIANHNQQKETTVAKAGRRLSVPPAVEVALERRGR